MDLNHKLLHAAYSTWSSTILSVGFCRRVQPIQCRAYRKRWSTCRQRKRLQPTSLSRTVFASIAYSMTTRMQGAPGRSHERCQLLHNHNHDLRPYIQCLPEHPPSGLLPVLISHSKLRSSAFSSVNSGKAIRSADNLAQDQLQGILPG